MRSATISYRFKSLLAVLILFPVLNTGVVQAQDVIYQDMQAPYRQEQLAQILAPVALYPDALLAQVLMASTYPIEVVEAERWVRMNTALKDEVLDQALLQKDWDPSVKALTHFPSILALMSERIGETTELGNAFLAQEGDVMAMVQRLRADAYNHGQLASTARQQVIIKDDVIIIRPTNPRVVYVPYYDPHYVYGSWRYPAYPPYSWTPRRVRYSYGIHYWPAFHFSYAYGGWSLFDWHRRAIIVHVHHRPKFVRHDQWHVKSDRWTHKPAHRRGVAYRDHRTARKFYQPVRQGSAAVGDRRSRSDFRQRELDRRITPGTSEQRRQPQSFDRGGFGRDRRSTQSAVTEQFERNRQQRTQSEGIQQQRRFERVDRHTERTERVRTNRPTDGRVQSQRVERSDRQSGQREAVRSSRSNDRRGQNQRIGRSDPSSRPVVQMRSVRTGRQNRQQVMPDRQGRQLSSRQPGQSRTIQQPSRQSDRGSAIHRSISDNRENRSGQRGRTGQRSDRSGSSRDQRQYRR